MSLLCGALLMFDATMTDSVQQSAVETHAQQRRAALRVGIVTFVLVTLLCLPVLIQDGPLMFAFIGTRFSDGIPEEEGGTTGYDGQFVYFIARDGADAIPYIDGPTLRYQRILMPVLARVLALGNADIVPWALLGINLVAHSTGAALIAYLLAGFGVSAWWALIYSVWIGNLFAIRFDLTEPLCFALALGAIVVYRHERFRLAVILLIFATLTKELGLIIAGGLALHAFYRRRWGWSVLLAGGPLLAFLTWWVVMYAWLGGLPTGYPAARGITHVPFSGLFYVLETDIYPDAGARAVAFTLVAIWLALPAVVLLLLALRTMVIRRAIPLTAAIVLPAVGFLAIMPGVAWEDPVAAYRVGMAIVVAGLLFVGECYPRRMRWLAAVWLPATLIIVLLPRVWFG